MQSHHSEFQTDGPANSNADNSANPPSHTNYLLIMRAGKAAGAIPALEPPLVPTELRAAATRAKVRRWASRRIGWLR